jgi:hypothetical protein
MKLPELRVSVVLAIDSESGLAKTLLKVKAKAKRERIERVLFIILSFKKAGETTLSMEAISPVVDPDNALRKVRVKKVTEKSHII